MPQPPTPEEDLRAVVAAWREHDCKPSVAAKAMGMNPSTFDSRLIAAKLRGLHLSEGARHSVTAAKMIPGEVRGGHRRVYDEETGKQIDTVRWSVPQDTVSEQDMLQRIADAFSGIPAAVPPAPPEHVQDDLCVLWPLYDVHWGMHAWGKETGGHDYDLKLAENDLIGAFERLLAMVPFTAEAVILIGGDFFHADDDTAQTPGHKHQLDVDGRVFKTIDTAIRALDFVIHRVLSKAAKVNVRVLRGNHDVHSHLYLTFALAERFRSCDVAVQKDPRDLFMYQWGRTSIFAHHGDKMKPEEMVMRLADQCPFWSSTPHRYAYTGHKHKMAAQRIGGVHWEQLDAFAPPDAYGSTWTGRRAFKAEVFHRHSGRVMSAHDPLERDQPYAGRIG
jgi:Calcineurin-like phosphoesterase